MSSRAALLIGKITHARKEWEALSSILTLKVRSPECNRETKEYTDPKEQEYPDGNRSDFIKNCQNGQYDDVVAIYRSNASNKVRIVENMELQEG